MRRALQSGIDRRTFLGASAAGAVSLAAGNALAGSKPQPMVHTVLGPVAPEKIGVALMHEHAPLVDWSELYERDAAPLASVRRAMLDDSVRLLGAFQKTVPSGQGAGAIVECTPIRVGRYPKLLVELARRTPVRIIATTGFWCEAFAPQHPWALRLGLQKNGVEKIAELYLREIRQGMEDPFGEWGEKFTDIKVGIIKCATSTYMRPSERRNHEAAAIASAETGCPITTHTTDGGGLEQAQLFLKGGAKPERIIIGHQGNLDDREAEEPHEYHRRLAALGCYVQFDRVGHEKYPVDKCARQIKNLIDAGHAQRVLVGHDHVPYFYENYAQPGEKKGKQAWKIKQSDFTEVTTQLVPALRKLDVGEDDVTQILIGNPRRVLAF